MLIKFQDLFDRYQLNIKGILHVGAHLCEEDNDYKSKGVTNIVWIEGNEELVKKMIKRGKKIYHYLVSDINNEEVEFKISNNGQSSSILDFGKHKDYYPEINFIKTKKYLTTRIDKIYENENLSKEFANFLNIDIQGAELNALKGMGDILINFDYLYLEVNKEEVYKGCCLVDEIDDYLKKYNFERVETSWTDMGWGDAFYKKK